MSMRETIFPVTDMSDLTWTVSRLLAGDFGRHVAGWFAQFLLDRVAMTPFHARALVFGAADV